MSNNKRTIRTFVIPTSKINVLGGFRKLVQSLSIEEGEKEEVIAQYDDITTKKY